MSRKSKLTANSLRHEPESKKSTLRETLLRAAALTLVFGVVNLRAEASADDLCDDVGGERTCSGDQSDGVDVFDQVTTLNVVDLTTPIRPVQLPIVTNPGIDFEFSGVPFFAGPLTLNIDDTADIAITAQAPTGAAIRVRGNGFNLGGVADGLDVNVISDATIGYRTNHIEQSRALRDGRPDFITLRQGYIASGLDATRYIGGARDAAAVSGYNRVACLALNFFGCGLVDASDFPLLGDPVDLTRTVFDFIGQQRIELDYWSAPIRPEEVTSINAGILAQSVAGGFGLAGRGGDVRVINTGSIEMIGAQAFGIRAESYALDNSIFDLLNDSNGGQVHVTHDGLIVMRGASSAGIYAESRGALWQGGSRGGAVFVDGTGRIIAEGNSGYGIYAASLGGRSIVQNGRMSGGDAGSVFVAFAGDVETYGNNGRGIYGTARGGDGGWGENAESTEGGGGGQQAEPGGPAGMGGVVTLNLLDGGSIFTNGNAAYGMHALSRGGDGGGGGEGAQGHQGGDGNYGGDGGEANANNWGVIETRGEDAYAIFVQSLGGNGGPAGDSNAWLYGWGGTGGAAGGGGAINVNNFGAIFTSGDRGHGIFAESIGGGGGAGGDGGGWIYSSGGDGANASSPRCTVQLHCPNGGIVTIANDGLIFTEGDGAHDIFAQSIGGGGGAGGDSDGWLFVSGGDGGDAGDGQRVSVINNGSLFTRGYDSSAIFAQSIGGGGGAGGDASGFGINVSVSLGGTGGPGGDGGDVYVENNGFISTLGGRTDAIFAQSIGGGGGSGGSATSVSAGVVYAVSVAIGGDGGSGGDGELVEVVNGIHGEIVVAGDFSTGIFAQSVGGGGGQGGSAYAFAAAASPDKFSLAVGVTVGGTGGEGGDGGEVRVTNDGAISTLDFNSIGVLAQSIGGGGGVGGASTSQTITVQGGSGTSVSATIAVGGDGGNGGDAGGLVTVNNTGTITTYGDGSTGVFAQSVGGGGGLGGDASVATAAFGSGDSSSVQVTVAVGGNGGAGGDGGKVRVTNSGDIVTLGAMANGITAQSVGGGGGIGGAGTQDDLFEDYEFPTEPPEFEDDESSESRDRARGRYGQQQQNARRAAANSASAGRAGKKRQRPSALGLGISIGGDGGSGGRGEEVYVDNQGDILTGGFMSMGIFAQSVGGGGGAGGGTAGAAPGDMSIGVGAGGTGGAADQGGIVTVYNSGSITTLQALAHGIFAQSVGGRGGYGGLGESEAGSQTGMAVSIGGGGGNGGLGGDVDVHQTGDLITFGFGAYGVFAQSVGGGGGAGGQASQGNYNSVALGGTGADGQHGGTVFVEATGDIVTEGDLAHGVFAQSVGGGGGAAGGVDTSTFAFSAGPFGTLDVDTGLVAGVGNFGIGGSGGGGGNGGFVDVFTEGTITTFGFGSHGIFAQSIGGGGGSGSSGGQTFPAAIGLNGSSGGTGVSDGIQIIHNGNIRTYGDNSAGLYAQSLSGAGSNGRGGDIFVRITGDVRGGGGSSGVGLFLSGGANNTIELSGGLVSALSGIAIAATDGDDHIFNAGTIDGSVGLGAGANSFHNLASGIFASGAAVDIGGGPLMNSGTLTPFGDLVAGETTIAGDYAQNASGVYTPTLSFDGPSDLVTVLGQATLNGRVQPLIGHVSTLQTGQFVTILTADAIVNSGININDADTLVIDYALNVSTTNVQIGIAEIDFDINSLSGAQSRIGRHVQSAWSAGAPSGLDDFMDYLASLTDEATYEEALNGLYPFDAFTEGAMPVMQNRSFLTGLMSCPGANMREEACTWVRAGALEASQDADGADPGYDQDAWRFQGGAQFARGDGWFGGISLAYEEGKFLAENASRSESQTLMFGGVLKREIGNWLFAGALDYSHTSYDRSRIITLPSFAIATSENESNAGAVRLRVSYLAEQGALYWRPTLDLDGYAVYSDGFSEEGAGPLNLVVDDGENTFGSATLSLELGGHFEAGGATLRPFVQVGASALSADSIDLDARFEGAPVGASDFTVSSRLPDFLTSLQAGIDLNFGGASVQLDFQSRAGDGYEDQSLTAKYRWSF